MNLCCLVWKWGVAVGIDMLKSHLPKWRTPITRLGASRVQFLERIEKTWCQGGTRRDREKIWNLTKIRCLYSTVEPKHGLWSVWGLYYSKRDMCLHRDMCYISYNCHMELTSAQIKAVIAKNSLALDFKHLYRCTLFYWLLNFQHILEKKKKERKKKLLRERIPANCKSGGELLERPECP